MLNITHYQRNANRNHYEGHVTDMDNTINTIKAESDSGITSIGCSVTHLGGVF